MKIKRDEKAGTFSMGVLVTLWLFLISLYLSCILYEIEEQKDYEREQIELLEDIKEELQELNNKTASKNQENETGGNNQ